MKNPKKPLGNTMVLYYQMRKIQIFPLFFLDFKYKSKKNNGNPKIQKSKTFRDFPKSFGFLDFEFLDFAENPKNQKSKNPKIQKSKNHRDSPKSFGFLDFWIFLNIVCSSLLYTLLIKSNYRQ